MATAFLLDSNVLFALMLEGRRGHDVAWQRLRTVPDDSVVAVSAMAVAEADVGCCLQERDTAEARAALLQFLQDHGFHIESISEHTASHYGELKSRLIRRYQPKRARWPERWKDKPTGADIQVEEPDLLMAAQALEHGYVLVTGDGMERIQEVLNQASDELHIQDWTDAGE